MKHWFSDLYASIEAMRLDEFAAGLAPDVEVVVGNNPAMNGRLVSRSRRSYFFGARTFTNVGTKGTLATL